MNNDILIFKYRDYIYQWWLIYIYTYIIAWCSGSGLSRSLLFSTCGASAIRRSPAWATTWWQEVWSMTYAQFAIIYIHILYVTYYILHSIYYILYIRYHITHIIYYILYNVYYILYIYIGNIGYKHGMSTFSLQATLVSYCLMG